MNFLEKKFNLEESILATLAYFDVFKYPLTLTELQRYLLKHKASLEEVSSQIEKLVSEKKVQTERGFYFLPQKNNLADLRLKNYSNYAIKYWKTFKRAFFFLKFIPFLRFVGVCNNLAINNVNQKSDIDIFLVADKNYIWLVRAFVVIILSITKLRHYGHHVAGKICLSFYVTEDNLNLESIAKKPYDIYLNYWVTQLVPVLDQNIYHKFQEENLWVQEMIPSFPGSFDRSKDIPESSQLVGGIKRLKEFFLSFGLGWLLNKLLKFVQLRRLKKSEAITEKHYQERDVVINDKTLRFYLNDERKHFRSEFEKRLQILKII